MTPETSDAIRLRRHDALFTLGDYVTGAVIGAATAMAVRAMVGPQTDMVIAMLVGMGAGMLVHLTIGLLVTPLLGMFHAMIPGSLIGMYGGMMFGMRDSMQGHAGSLGDATAVGAVFGILVIAAVQLYNRAICGPVVTQSADADRGE